MTTIDEKKKLKKEKEKFMENDEISNNTKAA